MIPDWTPSLLLKKNGIFWNKILKIKLRNFFNKLTKHSNHSIFRRYVFKFLTPDWLFQGRLKSGILTRYACATKTNALGYEKIIVISFVGMQKLWISAKFHERGSKNIACHAHWSFDLLWPITLLVFKVETCPYGFKSVR